MLMFFLAHVTPYSFTNIPTMFARDKMMMVKKKEKKRKLSRQKKKVLRGENRWVLMMKRARRWTRRKWKKTKYIGKERSF